MTTSDNGSGSDGYGTASARYVVGDVRDVLRSMPDASVDLVLTSPPFLGLRSYLPPDDPAKAFEMGSEPTPGEFLDALLDVVEECARVLAPHGSIAFELGDTYSGSGGAVGDYAAGGLRDGQQKFDGTAKKARRLTGANERPRPARNHRRSRQQDEDLGILAPRSRPGPSERDEMDGWPLDKSLCLVPELFRVALVYGFNPLTGRQTPRWRARNVVRWCRPNPPVGALADKFRPGTSDMVIACKSRSRFFDLDAVRGPGSPNTHARTAAGVESRPSTGKTADDERRGGNFSTLDTLHTTDGAPPLDWWQISTEAYPGSHYATWPTKLLERPIEAMCPRRVCTVCGQPSQRIVSVEHTANRSTNGPQSIERKHLEGGSAGYSVRADRTAETTGWTDCGHGSWRAGIVLDPFAGSGTTLAVAFGHGRSSIGIDLDKRNADLAVERVGMWLITEHHDAAEVA